MIDTIGGIHDKRIYTIISQKILKQYFAKPSTSVPCALPGDLVMAAFELAEKLDKEGHLQDDLVSPAPTPKGFSTAHG